MKHLRWVTLFVALLWCSNALALDGTSLDYEVQFPASGASMYVLDNAALEQSGASYFACGVRYKQKPIGSQQYYFLLSKHDNSGAGNAAFLLASDNGKPFFKVNKDPTGIVKAQISSPAPAPSSMTLNTATGQIFFNNPGICGVTLWINGNIISPVSNSNVNSMNDNNLPVVLGADGVVNNRGFEGNIYQAWLAYASIPIVTADQKVTDWSTSKTALPFDPAGVSRYFFWNGSGLTGNRWVESGVSLGKTPGQFDMLPNKNPQIIIPAEGP